METTESARNLYVDPSRRAPHAFVVLKENARADERELREFARANLVHLKAPHSVTFVKEPAALPDPAFRLPPRYINPNARTVASSTAPVVSNP